MPTYEYKCTSCEHRYETKEGFDAPARQVCPRCGAVTKRLLFPPPIVFKGSGFYITDSRKGSQATLSDGGTGAAGPSKTDGDSKPSTESTPAPAASSSDSSSSSSSSKSD